MSSSPSRLVQKSLFDYFPSPAGANKKKPTEDNKQAEEQAAAAAAESVAPPAPSQEAGPRQSRALSQLNPALRSSSSDLPAKKARSEERVVNGTSTDAPEMNESSAQVVGPSPSVAQNVEFSLPQTEGTPKGLHMPPLAVLLARSRRTLPAPLHSLEAMMAHMKALPPGSFATRRSIVSPEYFNDPSPVAVILKVLGYLPTTPLVRILVLHHVTVTKKFDLALEVLDLLRRDVNKTVLFFESQLRAVVTPPVNPATQEVSVVKALAFQQGLRRMAHQHSRLSRLVGPTPALVIAPSQIAVANYGLFLRGSLPEGTTIAGYSGELEEADADNSGYRMSGPGGAIIDARVERCLCSMMNDARHSVFTNKVRFASGGAAGVRAVTSKPVENEELFVNYGSAFKFDLEGTAASFSRALAPDFAAVSGTMRLPSLVVSPAVEVFARAAASNNSSAKPPATAED